MTPKTSSETCSNQTQTKDPAARFVIIELSAKTVVLIMLQEALNHPWLRGDTATDHNLLPEIKAYMAKARLRRGIEIVKLANRIEALKMQEDDPEDDLPEDAKAAAGDAPTLSTTDAGASVTREKRSLSKLAKGAIFREVVMAKVREEKEKETQLRVEKEAQAKEAKRKSWAPEQ